MVRPSAGSIVAEIDGARPRADRPLDRGDRRPRHRLRARGAAAVPQADGDGEPAARRVPAQGARSAIARNLDFCFETFPRLKERAQPARRQHERRRAADAGAGAGADVGAAHPADRRALGRPGAAAGRRTIDKIKELKEGYDLTVLMAEQNFTQAIRIADRGYVIVHGQIAFAGESAEELNNNELIREFYLGACSRSDKGRSRRGRRRGHEPSSPGRQRGTKDRATSSDRTDR